MKKKLLISAILAIVLIFGNMTVFAYDNSNDNSGYDFYNDEDDYFDDNYDFYDEDDYFDDNYDYDFYDNENDYSNNNSSYNFDYDFYHDYYTVGGTSPDNYNDYRAPENYTSIDHYLDENVYYCDESELFTDTQKQQIIDLLKNTSAEIGFQLAVYTAGYSRSDTQVENFTEKGAKTIFGTSPKSGTVFLYIDLDGHTNAYDTMYCYRQPFLYYTSDLFGNRIDTILRKMQKKFPSGGSEIKFSDIFSGLQVYCDQLIYYKNVGPENGSYYYNSDTGKFITVKQGSIIQTDTEPRPYRHWKMFLTASITGGLLAALGVYFSVKQAYKFKSSASASIYTSRNHTFITSQIDQFLGSHVTKTKIESSSGHGSRHHSGGFRGGGHSGGGGGGRHR